METLNESSLSRTKAYIENYDCCTISAFRPTNKLKNKEQSGKLGVEIRKLGYTHFMVDGSWVDNFGTSNASESKELTYFVVNSNFDKDFVEKMKKLGEKFDQDAIMIYPKGKKPYLIGTSKRKDSWPGYGKIVQQNKVEFGKEAQAMTRVNGRPYHASTNSYFNY